METADILEIRNKIVALIKKNPLADSVKIDGREVSMADALKKLEAWDSMLARANGTRRRFHPIHIC